MAAVGDLRLLVEDEDRRVEEWRLESLIRAGYPADDAAMLAADTDIDVHAACELLERGCPLGLAMEILL